MLIFVRKQRTITILKIVSAIILMWSIMMSAVGIWMAVTGYDLRVMIIGLVFFPLSLITLLGNGRMRVRSEEDNKET